jgi:molecular chaperone GrpE
LYISMKESMSDNENINGQPANETSAEQTPQSEPASQQSHEELLNQKVGELEQQVALLKDQLLRKAAEFENYKRRMENDFAAFSKFASENIISQLLPVLDDFNRSLKSGKEKSENDPLYKGVELIYQKFMKILEAQGLKTMDVVGKEFDVNFHDALLQVPRSDVAPHTVVEEVTPGYLLFDKVIRHAKVIVSAAENNEVQPQPKTTEEVKK